MQFTDAVTVAGIPPVAPDLLDACKRALARFVVAQGIPAPIEVEWRETGGTVEFIGHHEGRPFGIAAPKG